MKAVVFHDVGDIRLDDVADPTLQEPTDAIIRLTASAIGGSDLQVLRGTLGGMTEGTILGHEGVGIVEQLGGEVRNLQIGDRVVVPASIACGNCGYCRAGCYAQCDQANPNGKRAGPACFGGPASSGPFHGLQAEKARVPHANIGLVKLPSEISDDQAILLADAFPCGYFAAEMAEVGPGDSVAVFGCGAVGQFAIASAKLLGAARVFAIDRLDDRLRMAHRQGAEPIDFEREHPVECLQRLTEGIGVDRAIDAVGIEAEQPPAFAEVTEGSNRLPGAGQALLWAVQGLAKAGTLSIIGAYPPLARDFPIGLALHKNLTIKLGHCHHRLYIPRLIELIQSRRIDPAMILTQREPISAALEAFEALVRRDSGWIKVALQPQKRNPVGGDGSAAIEAVHGEKLIDEAIEDSLPTLKRS